jgi:hypothetical protein
MQVSIKLKPCKKQIAYVEAVAKAVIQAWKRPHQNLKGFFRTKKK